jgi:hypothetical protein
MQAVSRVKTSLGRFGTTLAPYSSDKLHAEYIERFTAAAPDDANALAELMQLRQEIRERTSLVLEYDADKLSDLLEEVEAAKDHAISEFDRQQSEREAEHYAAAKARADASAERARAYTEKLARPSVVMLLDGVSETDKASISALYFTAKQYKLMTEISTIMAGLGLSAPHAVQLVIDHLPEHVTFGGNPLALAFHGLDDADARYNFANEVQP